MWVTGCRQAGRALAGARLREQGACSRVLGRGPTQSRGKPGRRVALVLPSPEEGGGAAQSLLLLSRNRRAGWQAWP